MRHVLLASFLTCLGMGASGGLDDPPGGAGPPTPGQVFEAILEDHRELLRERDRILAGVRTEAELRAREEAFGYASRLEPIARRALDLAREHPEAPEALDAILWTIRRTDHADEAIALAADQVRDPRVGAILELIPYTADPAHERLGREILHQNPSREVRGQAGRFVVRCLYNRAMLARRQEADPPPEGPGASPPSTRVDPDALIAEAEALFERLRQEYDVPESFVAELREEAERERFELVHLAVGRPAPELEGTDLDGMPMRLSDFRGKVVLLSFWATWCEPCMAAVPEERALVRALEGKPFVLLGINGDADRDQAAREAERRGMTWRSWWDGAPPGPIAGAWNIRGWPTFYLIDREGIIRFKCVDYDAEGINAALALLLGEPIEATRADN